MSNGMNGAIDEQGTFFPFVRKGIATKITQKDELASNENDAADQKDMVLYRERAAVEIRAKIASGQIEKEIDDTTTRSPRALIKDAVISSETKIVKIVGPGDILSINNNAVMNISPAANSEGFPNDCFPYIEFDDPDFAWRYTPAAPNNQKLRPWIALVMCESDKCEIQNSGNGNKIVRFKITEKEYPVVFPPNDEIWKAAHAQGDAGADARFCRLLGMRREGVEYHLKENRNYTAIVIPVFEVGRLRGLGFTSEKLKDVVAQKPSWENSLEAQTKDNNHPSPLTFPAYYTWNFKTGDCSFDTLVEKLQIYEGAKSGIAVDVTSLGQGLTNTSANKTILMPAATKVPTNDPKLENPDPFPNPKQTDEKNLYNSLKDLLSRSPVFVENQQDVQDVKKKGEYEKDDPWVVPPIYGGKHSMALSFDHKDTPEWVRQVNLDLHYRAVAGLGKKTIQKNQEEFVNRAWKQVELVQALNRALYQKLLSIKVNASVRGLKYEWMDQGNENVFVARFMQRLSTMQKTKAGGNGKSLNDILKDKGIPAAFASAKFQRVTDRMSQKVQNLDSTTLMDHIAENQIFKNDWHPFHDLPTIEQLENTVKNLLPLIVEYVIKTTLGDYVSYYKTGLSTEIKDGDEFSLKFSGYKFGWKKLNHFRCKGSTNSSLKPVIPTDGYQAGVTEAFLKQIATSNDINVIGLQNSDYSQLFGNAAPITKLITLNYPMNVYFISVGKVSELMKIGAVEFYADYGETQEYWVPGSGGHGHYVVVHRLTSLGNTLSSTSLPDYILLDISKIDKKYIQTFNNPYEYAQFIRNSEEAGRHTLINEWEKFKKEVASLKQKFNASEDKTLDSESNSAKSSNNSTKSNQDIDNLRESALDDQTYKRIQEVACNYYKEFISNEDLRNKYVEDLLQSRYPIMAYPMFPEPVYHYLNELSEKFILPCIEGVPNNSIAMFENNTAFVEAYLCGMNTEMGRELLWREYPTDQRGSYFKKFWDSETDSESIRNDDFFDVKSLHTWTGNLGKNHCAGKDGLLLFAIKGNLIKLYPHTEIYLHKAKVVSKENGAIKFDYDNEAENAIIKPVAEAFLKDIYIVGFKISLKEALGSPKGPNQGYILTFKQMVENLAFKNAHSFEMEEKTSADYANNHIDTPSTIGRHVLTFLKKN